MEKENKKKKRIVKILIFVLIANILVMGGLFYYSKHRSVVPRNYMKKVKTGGDIEAKYIQKGPLKVSHLEKEGMHSFKKYEIWYPTAIDEPKQKANQEKDTNTSGKGLAEVNNIIGQEVIIDDKKYDIDRDFEKFPVVIFLNNSSNKASAYKPVFEHLASWGFICIGTEEEYTWNGFSGEMSLRLIQKLGSNENVDGFEHNNFFGRVDLDNVGVIGFTQGSVGVVNAITNNKHGSLYKTAVMISPMNRETAKLAEWDYDLNRINIPVFLISSTGSEEQRVVASLEEFKNIYGDIKSNTKVMTRRKNADREDMLYYADGYVTAWFAYYLQKDTEAGKFFNSDNPELNQNSEYQDTQIIIK